MNVLGYGMVMDVREFHLAFLELMVLVKILVRIMLILFLKNLIKNLVSVPDYQDLLTPDLYCADETLMKRIVMKWREGRRVMIMMNKILSQH